MTPNEINALKSIIDTDLVGKANTVGIAFEYQAFIAFAKAGHIQKRKFGVLGTTLLAEMLPAYADSHFCFVDWELSPKSAKVGG
jgi:hypothetical protein